MALSNLNALSTPLDEQQLVDLQTVIAKLSFEQVAWVSGYLAGLGAVGDPVSAPEKDAARGLTILYGSQTGNARSVADGIGRSALGLGHDVRVWSMADFKGRDLAKEKLVLVVVSTQGEGEPPETARDLHGFLKAKRAPRLAGLRYAVLGLGDSSYELFCQAAIDFDMRLADLGAERISPLRCCDLAYEEDAESWSKNVLDRVDQLDPERGAEVVALPGVRFGSAPRRLSDLRLPYCGIADAGPVSPAVSLNRASYSPRSRGKLFSAPRSLATDAQAGQPPRYDKEFPFTSTLLESRRITTDDAVADVRHIALGIDPRSLRFEPGDSLGVRLRNDPELIGAILDATGADGGETVVLSGEAMALRQALSGRLELTRLHPAVAKAWAHLVDAGELQELSRDAAKLRAYVAGRQLIDLLTDYPGRVSAPSLAGLLHPLQPRLYSIASSQAEIEDEVHLAVSRVSYHSHGRDHKGASSGYLSERLEEEDPLDVYVVENPVFRLPKKGSVPIIMIGAGTGIAPYRAFLQQRAANGDKGRNWLIFGNRHFRRDFLYQLDWQSYRKAGLLDQVSLAFSRDNGEKRYVQHRLREEGAEIHRWLGDGAHVYVCGSTDMGREVHTALVDLIAREASLSSEAAVRMIDNLRHERRYHRDLY